MQDTKPDPDPLLTSLFCGGVGGGLREGAPYPDDGLINVWHTTGGMPNSQDMNRVPTIINLIDYAIGF